ncbi:MAG: MetQ/NlpA family ABC transporter substrate-binding protein [Lactobacillaceae bacterium]|nr:MetQ/NlpA family ABC transporter substrate-binding protein [Lactobacillaceae bacterium]
MKKQQGIYLTLGTVLFASTVIGATGITQPIHASGKTVTVGLVGDSDKQLWDFVKRDAKQKYNLNIKLKLFTDYIKPNQALVDKSLDLNSFQTLNYFNVQNKKFKNQLVPIGKTYVTPISLYSLKYKTLKQLPEGATIVVPNDPSNETRALDVLEAAGLIKYNHEKSLPTAQDITDNPKHFVLKEVQSDQTVGTLKSEDAAVVNTNYALDAKLGTKETLFTEPINAKTKGYLNYIVARKGTQKTKAYQQVVKSYQTKATAKHMKALYGNAEIPAWNIKLN